MGKEAVYILSRALEFRTWRDLNFVAAGSRPTTIYFKNSGEI
jgi:hypothetical protein